MMNKTGILNYTTTVSESKSLESIRLALVQSGAEGFAVEHSGGVATLLRFSIPFEQGRKIVFVIECKANTIQKYLESLPKIASKYKTKEHAQKVAWRVVKTWLEVMLSLVRIGTHQLTELFLPFAEVMPGVTYFQRIESSGLKLISESYV